MASSSKRGDRRIRGSHSAQGLATVGLGNFKIGALHDVMKQGDLVVDHEHEHDNCGFFPGGLGVPDSFKSELGGASYTVLSVPVIWVVITSCLSSTHGRAALAVAHHLVRRFVFQELLEYSSKKVFGNEDDYNDDDDDHHFTILNTKDVVMRKRKIKLLTREKYKYFMNTGRIDNS